MRVRVHEEIAAEKAGGACDVRTSCMLALSVLHNAPLPRTHLPLVPSLCVTQGRAVHAAREAALEAQVAGLQKQVLEQEVSSGCSGHVRPSCAG
mgnify:CR=1 FL=1